MKRRNGRSWLITMLSACLCLALLTGGVSALAEGEAQPIWSGKLSAAPIVNAAPESYEENIVAQYLCEKLLEKGYDLEFELVYLERQQYNTLLNLLIASGDQPDLFVCYDATMQAQLYSQGVIASWDEDFFRENCPSLAQVFDEGGPNGITKGSEWMTWAMTKAGDGAMITIPSIAFELNMLGDISYNGLWLDRLGVTELPKTLDEFEELMRRFVKEDPDGNGKDDTYGFSSTMFEIVYGAYGVIPGEWKKAEDGGVIYGAVAPGMRDALARLASMYAEGLIDPEYITGENNGGRWNISHAMANNRIGVSHICGYHYFATQEELQKYTLGDVKAEAGGSLQEMIKVQGEDAYCVAGPALIGPNGDVGGHINNPAQCVYSVYSANLPEADLAACFQIIDIFQNDAELAVSARYGLPGVHWKYAETADGQVGAVTGLLGGTVANEQGADMMCLFAGPSDTLSDGYFSLISAANPSTLIDIEKRTSGENMRAGHVNQVFVALDSMVAYGTELGTYSGELFNRIIRGEAEIDEYDAFVEYWYANGGQEIMDEANAWYASVQPK